MNKVTTGLAAAIVALSFTACDKTNNGTDPVSSEGTYARLSFKEKPAGTRALTDGQTENTPGTEGESQVTSAYFLTSAFSGKQTLTEIPGFTATGSEENKAYQSAPFLYTGAIGAVNSGLVVNAPGALTQANLKPEELITLAKAAAPATATTMEKYAKTGAFLMSTKSNVEIDIKDNVKKDQVAEGNNRFVYTVERVAAKLQVIAPEGGIVVEDLTSPANGEVKYLGAIENARYALAGGAMKSYLFGDKADSRILIGDADPMKYGTFTSAIHDNVPTTGEGENIVWRKDIQKVSDLVAWTNKTDADFATLNSLPIVNAGDEDLKKSTDNGIFFLENSINATGNFMMHDVAHAKFYAKFSFKPEQKVYGVAVDGEGNKSIVEVSVDELGKMRKDMVEVSKEWVDDLSDEYRQKLINGKKDKLQRTPALYERDVVDGIPGRYELRVIIKPGSFFVGKTTGKVYATLSAARLDGNKSSYLYNNGKMYWEVPANKQPNAAGDGTGYCDARRNNIYSLRVDRIKGLGDNWDNSDPDDPNIPKPKPGENPDEPDKPNPKPVDPKENYIQVEARLLQWNLVWRGVDLER